MQLSEILNNSSLESLTSIKKEEEAREYAEWQERRQKRIDYIKKHGFNSRQELIDYVKNGNKLYGELDGNYIQYFPEKNQVGHYVMQFNDVDMAIGWGWTWRTMEEFIKWTEWMDNEEFLQDGWIPSWYHLEYKNY